LNRVSLIIRARLIVPWRLLVANSPQAQKRARQNDKRRAHNAGLRSLVRTKIKQVVAAIDADNAQEAQAAYDSAVPVIDRMANRGIIKKNKAARHKSRLNARVKALSN
jgi:small subunit ribosomal protein S20